VIPSSDDTRMMALQCTRWWKNSDDRPIRNFNCRFHTVLACDGQKLSCQHRAMMHSH